MEAARGDCLFAGINEGRSAFPRCTRTSQKPDVRVSVLWSSTTIGRSKSCGVIAPDVGGGFGSKIYIYPEEHVVAAWGLKRRCRRPVGKDRRSPEDS